jgi:ribosomal-protein-alanine N-acetyltransferase
VLTDGPVRLRPLSLSDVPAWRELKDRNRAWLSRWEATVPPGDESGRINFRQMVRRLRSEALAGRMLPFAIDYAEPVEGTELIVPRSAGRTDAARGGAAAKAAATSGDVTSAPDKLHDVPGMAEASKTGSQGHRPLRRTPKPSYRLVGQITVSSITWGSLRSGNIGYWMDEACAGRGITPNAVALTVDHCFRVCGLHRIEVCIRPENTPSLRVVEKLGFRPEGVRQNYLHIDGAWRDHATFALTSEEVPEGFLNRWHTQRSANAP